MSPPVHYGRDSEGPFYQYGHSGKKYRYNPGSEASRKRAKQKAHIQEAAIVANGYKGK